MRPVILENIAKNVLKIVGVKDEQIQAARTHYVNNTFELAAGDVDFDVNFINCFYTPGISPYQSIEWFTAGCSPRNVSVFVYINITIETCGSAN